MPVTLLDTSALAPQERDVATREFLETVTEFDVAGHACPPESIRTRIRAWDLGNVQLNVTDGPWLRISLNHRATTEAVSIATQVRGQTAKGTSERRQTYRRGDISLIDMAGPFQSWADEDCISMWFRFSYAELCLPAEAIGLAAGDLATSPLYELFQAHLLQLYQFLDEDVPVSAAESLGSATLELARAVIATVGDGELARNDVANQALLTRIEAYVQQHLPDPALSPESIAQAHHISVRQLYKLWSGKELGLAEWIMRGRLEGARHDIAKGGSPGIAAVARRWGFADGTHFGRRFRAAYGLSPGEWKQAQHHQERARAAGQLGEIMLLMDTSRYPAEDRAELIRDALSDMTGVRVAPADGDALMHVRWRAWDMGDGCTLLNMQSTGIRFVRPPARFSSAESPLIGFSVMPSGVCRTSQNDRHEIVPGGGMFITEMNEPFTCQLPAGSEGSDLMIPLEVLDVPLSDVRKAAQWLPRSPLYGLTCQHLLSLTKYTKEFDAPQPSAHQAALHVLRALVKSFGAD